MKELTIEEVREELRVGIIKIAMYFVTTLGVPFERFKEEYYMRFPTFLDQWMFYQYFKKKYPKIFK